MGDDDDLIWWVQDTLRLIGFADIQSDERLNKMIAKLCVIQAATDRQLACIAGIIALLQGLKQEV